MNNNWPPTQASDHEGAHYYYDYDYQQDQRLRRPLPTKVAGAQLPQAMVVRPPHPQQPQPPLQLPPVAAGIGQQPPPPQFYPGPPPPPEWEYPPLGQQPPPLQSSPAILPPQQPQVASHQPPIIPHKQLPPGRRLKTLPLAVANKPITKRLRMGCLTCRQRKKRCCETRPKCAECARLKLNCQWPKPGTEHKNKNKDTKIEENTIDHEEFGKIKVLRGIVERR